MTAALRLGSTGSPRHGGTGQAERSFVVGRTRIATYAGVAVVAALLAPTAAQGATKTVTAGPPAATLEALEPLQSDANAFFPRRIAVRVGDAVRFRINGFHS